MKGTKPAQNGGRNAAGGGDDEADAIPITQTFVKATVRPEKPMTKRKDAGGVSNIASAAVGGLDTDTGVDNDAAHVSGDQQSSMSKLFGACGPAEALDLDLMRGAATKLRVPTRAESADFVKSLSLPERLRDVRNGLNTKLVGACVGNRNGYDEGSGRKSSATAARKQPACTANGAVGQDNSLSSTNAQGIHRSSTTATTTTSVDESSNASYHTLNTKEERLEEEMHHLERMTSWNTLGTVNTFGTNVTNADDTSTDDNINALGMLGLDPPLVDDDGNEISSEMLKDLKARRERKAAATSATSASQSKKKKKKTPSSRRRVVQFDYPPISSLRECPRLDPADQGKLFFSEEELDELEEDRIACKMVDDVEVVAVPAMAPVASSATASSPNGAVTSEVNGIGRRGKMMTKREARKLALGASQKLKGGTSSISPNGSKAIGTTHNSISRSAVASGTDVDNNKANTATTAAGNNPGTSEGNTTGKGGGPMLKGVQIYLRQRSTNEAAKRGKS
jgi:hypothetical protein